MRKLLFGLFILFSCSQENISPNYILTINSPIYGQLVVESDQLLQLGDMVEYDEHFYLVTENSQ